MKTRIKVSTITSRIIPLLLMISVIGCSNNGNLVGSGDAASKVYVAPGEHDEFYAFLSGGFSGQVSVYGLPSGRLLKLVPVFSLNPENGYGFNEETKPLLETSYGSIPWDDAHHPQLSKTNGETDGRWLFINANNTPRIARIDLTTFETSEIIEIPNTSGSHASPYLTENTEYLVSSSRFSVPVPNVDVPIDTYKENFKGVISYISVDQTHGHMKLAFQIRMPGFNYDLSHAGKGPSHGWSFFTSYNSEQANTLLEVNASRNDRDFIAAVNWKKAEEYIASGGGTKMAVEYRHNLVDEGSRIATSVMHNEVLMIDPADVPGLVFFLPTPKSPHGVDVDPSGEYIVAGGKLASIIPVHSFTKMLAAIENNDVEGVIEGIPVLKYEATIAGEVQDPGLGPLHTEFDGQGFAYTTAFISSEIVKWSLSDFKVVDRIPTYYSVGHLMIPGGDSRKPDGKYVVALNKITKDRYLPTGPELIHSAQLYDISGPKMQLLLDFPVIGEPHYAQAIAASKIKDKQVRIFPIETNTHPKAVKSEGDVRVVRNGNEVEVYMTKIRSHFAPDNIEGIHLGDKVTFYITNLEQDWDVPHGFAIQGANNAELLIMPGETRTFVWVPQKVGIFSFYCTDFCSALHQEMTGYIRVSPKGANVPIKFGTGK